MKLFSISCIAVNVMVIFVSVVFGLGPFHSHEFSSPTCTEPAICLACGLEGDAALGHEASQASCTQDSKCRRCGVVLELAKGHDFGEATFLAPKRCSRCLATEGEAGYVIFIEAVSELDPYEDELATFINGLGPASSVTDGAFMVKRISEIYRDMAPHYRKIVSVCKMYPELGACESVATQILEKISALSISVSTDPYLIILEIEKYQDLFRTSIMFYEEANRALEGAAASL